MTPHSVTKRNDVKRTYPSAFICGSAFLGGLKLKSKKGLNRRCWGGRPHGIVCQNWSCEQPRPEPSMSEYKRVAIDTSKAVFTLHGIDGQDHPVLRTTL